MDLHFGQYRLKLAERQLTGPEGPVELSARGFDILALLLRRPDDVIRKAEILEAVWPGIVVEDNTLQVHMSALRKALGAGMIMTVHGHGYKFTGPRPVAIPPEQDALEPADHEKPHPMFNFAGRTKPPVTGGCFCGEIRCRITAPALDTVICHCRMCQRFSGSAFSIGSVYPSASVTFTKGQPKYFKSSPFAERGFCATCGSSLAFRPSFPPVTPEWDGWILIDTGSLDNPFSIVPLWQLGIESQMPWLDLQVGSKRVRCQDSPDVVEAWAAFGLPVP
ncbi:winged helix-turn-helix domain-containing protein [Defluviimonas sp. WL0024]|uniref:Winged helix-turn-helix domain-containing protein n=2 Tax=Albidovulum TaxID=205889 RepID=A0ABT3J6W4_9RHOB|nr:MULTISPECIES: winged helix-turn-helix domain-containing protein [Defluviimonas]MCU9850110.1 winged helix-turn-helix domain-containing protein [Defluviimonas sp. WL0024]MCW3783416.1 winged helix-turn-helix domain-containing protein [Defluviimonas salinarum]